MRVFSLLIVVILFAACSSNEDGYLKPLNLLEYGVPLTILAPDSVDIKKADLVVQKEVTIKSQKSDEFEIRIYYGDATTSSVGDIKAQQMQFIKDAGLYSKTILDEPEGFIYESSIDSSLYSYGFRRILLMGDQEYIFHSGSGIYTQEQAEEMYHATKPQEMVK